MMALMDFTFKIWNLLCELTKLCRFTIHELNQIRRKLKIVFKTANTAR